MAYSNNAPLPKLITDVTGAAEIVRRRGGLDESLLPFLCLIGTLGGPQPYAIERNIENSLRLDAIKQFIINFDRSGGITTEGSVRNESGSVVSNFLENTLLFATSSSWVLGFHAFDEWQAVFLFLNALHDADGNVVVNARAPHIDYNNITVLSTVPLSDLTLILQYEHASSTFSIILPRCLFVQYSPEASAHAPRAWWSLVLESALSRSARRHDSFVCSWLSQHVHASHIEYDDIYKCTCNKPGCGRVLNELLRVPTSVFGYTAWSTIQDCSWLSQILLDAHLGVQQSPCAIVFHEPVLQAYSSSFWVLLRSDLTLHSNMDMFLDVVTTMRIAIDTKCSCPISHMCACLELKVALVITSSRWLDAVLSFFVNQSQLHLAIQESTTSIHHEPDRADSTLLDGCHSRNRSMVAALKCLVFSLEEGVWGDDAVDNVRLLNGRAGHSYGLKCSDEVHSSWSMTLITALSKFLDMWRKDGLYQAIHYVLNGPSLSWERLLKYESEERYDMQRSEDIGLNIIGPVQLHLCLRLVWTCISMVQIDRFKHSTTTTSGADSSPFTSMSKGGAIEGSQLQGCESINHRIAEFADVCGRLSTPPESINQDGCHCLMTAVRSVGAICKNLASI